MSIDVEGVQSKFTVIEERNGELGNGLWDVRKRGRKRAMKNKICLPSFKKTPRKKDIRQIWSRKLGDIN